MICPAAGPTVSLVCAAKRKQDTLAIILSQQHGQIATATLQTGNQHNHKANHSSKYLPAKKK